MVQQPTITLNISFSTLGLDAVDIEYPVELAEHQAEYTCGDAKRGAEDDADVAHRHLVDGCILHDEDQVCSECAQEAVVGQW